MSSPRLLLGFVKQLIRNLINTLKNELRYSNPANSLEAIASSLGVAQDEYQFVLEKIRNISNNVTRKVVT